jgi:hypothetical protein
MTTDARKFIEEARARIKASCYAHPDATALADELVRAISLIEAQQKEKSDLEDRNARLGQMCGPGSAGIEREFASLRKIREAIGAWLAEYRRGPDGKFNVTQAHAQYVLTQSLHGNGPDRFEGQEAAEAQEILAGRGPA